MATTRVYLIRHGATQLSAEDRFAGETDVELSDIGRGQARRLAQRLKDQPIAAVFASPLGRTVETARIIAEPHSLEIKTDPGLREISHGRWEQMTRAQVEEQFPEEYRRWENDPFSFAPERGETGLAVTARALPALLGVVERNAGKQVIIVSHKATIRLLLSCLLGFDPRTYRDRLDQNPCALNIIDWKDPQTPRLSLFNDTSHYADDPSCIPAMPEGRLSKAWSEPAK